MLDRHETRLASSSLAMTRSDGSSLAGPGRISSIVVSPSPAAAGDVAKETYWLSGACLLRLAVFTAVMICRVMQSSAKLRKLDSRSERKSLIDLYRPSRPSWIRSAGAPPSRKYEDA